MKGVLGMVPRKKYLSDYILLQFTNVWKQLQDLMSSDTNIMVAHSAAFDVDMLKKEGIEPNSVICPLKLARYFDKDGVVPALQPAKSAILSETQCGCHPAYRSGGHPGP